MTAHQPRDRQHEHRLRGFQQDLATRLKGHLFVLSPNNSGSTFVAKALARCAAAWSLPTEGQLVFGFVGPKPRDTGRRFIWAAEREWMAEYGDPTGFDWHKTRRAWYAQASARDAHASILVEKSPPFLLVAEQLRATFHNARFLVMVRDPLATCEGILRARSRSLGEQRKDVRRLAAQHVIHCFEQQSRNLAKLASCSVLFTYEMLCEQPSHCAEKVRAVAPEFDDLDFDIRLRVKGAYDERLRNMNEEQRARLDPADRAFIENMLQSRRELFAEFGYRV